MRSDPVTIEEVKDIVDADLANCDAEQLAAFQQYKVAPYYAPIVRYGNREFVVVVARRRSAVIYWEDVEEGFNVSPLADDGTISEHWCNQDELGLALNSWIEGRKPTTKLGHADPIP